MAQAKLLNNGYEEGGSEREIMIPWANSTQRKKLKKPASIFYPPRIRSVFYSWRKAAGVEKQRVNVDQCSHDQWEHWQTRGVTPARCVSLDNAPCSTKIDLNNTQKRSRGRRVVLRLQNNTIKRIFSIGSSNVVPSATGCEAYLNCAACLVI
jgi:hypothetical protein